MADELRRIRPRFGAGDLAATLGVTRASIYHWIAGDSVPHPAWAGQIVGLARRARTTLTLEQVWGQDGRLARVRSRISGAH